MIAERTTKIRDNRAVVNRTARDRATLNQTWEKPRRPMALRGPLIVRGVQELRFRSPEALAVLVASFCVSLLCFYVSAYARVTADTVNAARFKASAEEAEEKGDKLQAELAKLSSPTTVEQTAKSLRFVPGAPPLMPMISPSPAATPAPSSEGEATPAVLTAKPILPETKAP